MVETVKIEGLRELDRKLSKLPKAVGFKALRGAMMASTTPMLKLAKANALATGVRNRDAGATAAAMGRWVRKIHSKSTVLFLGPKNKAKKALAIYNAHHGTEVTRLKHFHLVEFGSIHGPAQPFLRPAFHAMRHSTARRFGVELKKQIEKAAKLA